LAVFLLVAEAFAVSHPLDFAAHADGEPCKICLGVASFGHGDVAQTADVVGVSMTFELDSLEPVAPGFTAPVRQSARGPPVAS
jgi:hypothetical protein